MQIDEAELLQSSVAAGPMRPRSPHFQASKTDEVNFRMVLLIPQFLNQPKCCLLDSMSIMLFT